MAYSLDDITCEAVDKPPRIVLCGTHKIGKSTFASLFPDPFIIPIIREEGVDAIKVPKAIKPVDSWESLMEWMEFIEENKDRVGTVIIDSLSTLEPIIFAEICARSGAATINQAEGGYGAGFRAANIRWHQLQDCLNYLRTLGIGSIVIGHVEKATFDDPMSEPYDQYVMNIHRGAAAIWQQWADSILFMNSVVYVRDVQKTQSKKQGTITKPGKGKLICERALFTKNEPAHPGGGRDVYGHLPSKIDLGDDPKEMYNIFMAAVEAARKEGY